MARAALSHRCNLRPSWNGLQKRASHAQEAGWSAISADSLGAIDIVLLSHDHHPDNLDHVGRALLTRADKVITTVAGAERLGGNALGLANWQSIEIPVEDGAVTITGTPCRHGPAEMDRGPVTGFNSLVLEYGGSDDLHFRRHSLVRRCRRSGESLPS